MVRAHNPGRGMIFRIAGILFPLISAAALAGDGLSARGAEGDWPRWGGPAGDFKVKDAGLARSWPAEGPPVLWKRELGEGYSAVAAQDGILFTMFREGEDEVVSALLAESGDQCWEYRYSAPPYAGQTRAYGQGPNAPLLVSGGRLFSVGFTGKLHCLEVDSGRALWSRDLVRDWSARVQFYGYSNALTEYRGSLLVLVGGEECGVVAVRPESGEVLWKSAPCEVSYAPPALIDVDGHDQFVFFSPTEVIGMDPSDGAMLWSHPVVNLCKTNCTGVVWGDDNLLWVATKGVGGTRVLKLTQEDGATDVESLWLNRRVRVYQWNAIRAGDRVYTTSGEGRSAYAAIDIHTGKTLAELPGYRAANSIRAGDLHLVLDEGGRLSLLDTADGRLEVLASTQLFDSVSWTVPTLVGNTLFARNRESIVAVDLGAVPGPAGAGGAPGRALRLHAQPGGQDPVSPPRARSAEGGATFSQQAARILDRAVEAAGGATARAIRNRVVEGRLEFPGMDLEARVAEYTAAPNLRYFRLESDVLGTVEMGSDGSQVWYLAEGTGAVVESGAAREAGLRESAFHGLEAWRELYRSADHTGEEQAEGELCDRIEMNPRAGNPEVRYYSRDTGLLVRREMTRLSVAMGAMPMELTFGDYRLVDGVPVPHRIHTVMHRCGTEHERLLLVSSVRHDADLPPSRFDLPDEVMAALLSGAKGCSSGAGDCAPGGR